MHGHVVSAPAQPPPDPIPQCSSLEAETWIEQSPINSATLPIYVNPLLFAYRETPQSSMGFSPFELLYGRTVRGPLAILKELWTDEIVEPETKTTYHYVLDLQDRFQQTYDLARTELQKSLTRYKSHYDKHATPRKFVVGDKVLLTLPTDNNKLLINWKGPFFSCYC